MSAALTCGAIVEDAIGVEEGPQRSWVDEPWSNEVQLWFLDPDQIDGLAAGVSSVLSEGEMKKAPPFRDEDARKRWAGRQVALRQVLGSYLGLDPGAVRVGKGFRGKPELAGPRKLHFSVSSSEGWWLAAVSDHEVGVDLERIRPLPEMDDIAGRYFDETELACLQAAAGERERLADFYRHWTRKEAFLKLTGEGLAGLPGLRRADVGRRAWLEDLRLNEAFSASLALARPPDWVRRRTWVSSGMPVRSTVLRVSRNSLTLALVP